MKLNKQAKWLSVPLRTKWFRVRVQLQSLNKQIYDFRKYTKLRNSHCVKSVQIRSNFWSVFFRIRRDMKYLSVFSPNAGKYGPEITPYLDTFQAVSLTILQLQHHRLQV